MPERIVNGVAYHYETAGSGDPLVLLHGFTGSSANWQSHLPVFARRYRVIAIDLLGHGRSASPADPERYAIEFAAADVVAVVEGILTSESIKNTEGTVRHERFDLLGYSMGGRVALFMALRYSQRLRRLILESASPGLEPAAARAARRRQDEELASWIEAHEIAEFVDRWEALPLWASQAQLPAAARAALRAQRLQNSRLGLASSLRGMGTGAQPSLWAELPSARMPVLLLAGALDEKFVNIHRQMSNFLLNGQVKEVAGAGHTIHLERPLPFQQHVLDFLERA